MAAKKVYAVRKGRKTGIFTSWDACKSSITGFAGAEYKGFTTREEANAFLKGSDMKTSIMSKETPLLPDSPDKVISYVDGSYEHSLRRYGFGCVFILADGRIFTENGSGDNPDSAALRNVTGEMLGAMFAVQFAMANGFKEVEIRYDYEGIEKWVTGVWKSKTELTQKYAKAMTGWSKVIEISFTKVKAHSNELYNEMADQLAKDAVQTGTGIPKVRKMEEMMPYGENQTQ